MREILYQNRKMIKIFYFLIDRCFKYLMSLRNSFGYYHLLCLVMSFYAKSSQFKSREDRLDLHLNSIRGSYIESPPRQTANM